MCKFAIIHGVYVYTLYSLHLSKTYNCFACSKYSVYIVERERNSFFLGQESGYIRCDISMHILNWIGVQLLLRAHENVCCSMLSVVCKWTLRSHAVFNFGCVMQYALIADPAFTLQCTCRHTTNTKYSMSSYSFGCTAQCTLLYIQKIYFKIVPNCNLALFMCYIIE